MPSRDAAAAETPGYQGALAGLRVLEFAGMGPVPFCGMMLADFGADVVRVDRPAGKGVSPGDLRGRNKRSVTLDLRAADDVARLKELVVQSDVLIEGYRPGVMERLGLGPDECLRLNPRLIYARSTGWGQTGPLAQEAGHDINYIALSGILDMIGTRDSGPVVPMNILGDYAGGGMYVAFGILCAVVARQRTGRGQVVDAAMIDGVNSLGTVFHDLLHQKKQSLERGSNMLDGGAPFYTVYSTADGKHVAVGCIEQKFYDNFLAAVGIARIGLPDRLVKENWPQLRAVFASVLGNLPLEEVIARTQGKNCCVTPVLNLEEARSDPHAVARDAFTTLAGRVMPAVAPRLSVTPGRICRLQPSLGQHNDEILGT